MRAIKSDRSIEEHNKAIQEKTDLTLFGNQVPKVKMEVSQDRIMLRTWDNSKAVFMANGDKMIEAKVPRGTMFVEIREGIVEYGFRGESTLSYFKREEEFKKNGKLDTPGIIISSGTVESLSGKLGDRIKEMYSNLGIFAGVAKNLFDTMDDSEKRIRYEKTRKIEYADAEGIQLTGYIRLHNGKISEFGVKEYQFSFAASKTYGLTKPDVMIDAEQVKHLSEADIWVTFIRPQRPSIINVYKANLDSLKAEEFVAELNRLEKDMKEKGYFDQAIFRNSRAE